MDTTESGALNFREFALGNCKSYEVQNMSFIQIQYELVKLEASLRQIIFIIIQQVTHNSGSHSLSQSFPLTYFPSNSISKLNFYLLSYYSFIPSIFLFSGMTNCPHIPCLSTENRTIVRDAFSTYSEVKRRSEIIKKVRIEVQTLPIDEKNLLNSLL